MTHLLHLTSHPATPTDAVRRCDVRVRRSADGAIALTYRLEADMARLRVPPACAPQRADGLWRHTCFEAFVAGGDGPGYLEFNLAPSTCWAAYRFTGYREGMAPAADLAAPAIAVRADGRGIELEALLHPATRGPVRLALAAVVELADGEPTCWALRHPPGRPDFHHPDGFVLAL